MKAVTDSVTKNRQSIDGLRAMVTRAFGDAQVPEGEDWVEELGHGWFNVAYRIRLRDGRSVVLKIAPLADVEVMTYERNMMRTEVHALTMVRERTSVPVPAVHFYDESHELCDADYFFMEFVDADNLGIIKDRLSPEVYGACQEALGAANHALNQIKGDHFGPLLDDTASGATWRQVFTGIVEDVLRDGERRNVDIGWDYDVIRRLVAEHADCLDEVTEPTFVEWDLWDSNVMVRDGALVSILDHERALYGDPIMEAGFVATETDDMSSDVESFMRGYGRESFTPAERTRRRLYNLHLLLIMVIETVYRGHTDSSQYDFARTKLAQIMETFGHRR
ncbi:phosphotransferase family protein [Streptosporangium sp. CA-115845]|uniref:phosphotransferase family protein n=1 Tax=Streptosporangium sp. CA-115845 TaxID=3240071 RepID=UPI003D8B7BE9